MLPLLLLPVIGIVLFVFFKNPRVAGAINIVISLLELLLVVDLTRQVVTGGRLFFFGQMVNLDSLAVLQTLIIGTIGLMAAVYSYRYIIEEVREGKITGFQVKLYYVLFNCFVLSMLGVAVLNNLGLMWIALEATTLSTAFLIGFNGGKTSLEAAWKYIIICTLGIGLGLLGISLFMYGAVSQHASVGLDLANWTVLLGYAKMINVKLAAIAFAIILIGFGTKVGFAPMHTWLPDAHSESPSPISAMMSGILLNLALYGVIRFYILAVQVVDKNLLRGLLIDFGVLSLIVAAASILRQRNYKRLLAFSSIEHMGIMALGLGFGGPGVFFALFHSIIHALSKALLFLISGNMLHRFKTKEIAGVRGMFRRMPIDSAFLLVGILAITGMPPFASFVSEFGIIQAGVAVDHWVTVIILAVALLCIFAGFIVHFSRMLFYTGEEVVTGGTNALEAMDAAGINTAGVDARSLHAAGRDATSLHTTGNDVASKNATDIALTGGAVGVAATRESKRKNRAPRRVSAPVIKRELMGENLLAPAILTALILGLSIYVPNWLQTILRQAAAIIG